MDSDTNAGLAIVPAPKRLERTNDTFRFDESTVIGAGAGAESVAATLRGDLAPAMGLALPITAIPESGSGVVRLDIEPALSAGHYRIDVTSTEIHLRGGDRAGLFASTQTLRQLLPAQVLRRFPVPDVDWTVPGVRIEDSPRFGWRGFMLDISRHYFGRELIRKLIDALALHRFNVLHLHLTDDQGWRVEITRYPKLTEVGSRRTASMLGRPEDGRPAEWRYDNAPHGGYLSQADIRDLLAYAAERHITVVPEIDIPGHSQAAIAAYPDLGNTGAQLPVWTDWGVNPRVLNVEDETIDFYRNIFHEIFDLFPGTYIHIGGDECPKDEWRASSRAQARIRELGLRDEDQLQSWLIGQFASFFVEHGRRLVGWDEILEGGLAPGATVMSWRGEDGGIKAARAGHDVVMTPYDDTYLYLRQTDDPAAGPPGPPPTLSLERIFAYEPVPAALTDEEAARVLGAQAQMWTEFVQSNRQLEQLVFPRLCAFAERVWGSPQEPFNRFLDRMRVHVERLHVLDLDMHPLP